MKNDYYVGKLLEYYEATKQKNRHYSKRAFARDFDMDSSDLINILKYRKNVTPKIVFKFGVKIGLNEKELLDFLKPVILSKNIS